MDGADRASNIVMLGEMADDRTDRQPFIVSEVVRMADAEVEVVARQRPRGG